MKKFALRTLPAAVAMTAVLAFSAQAQVHSGVNSNIDNDARVRAGVSADASVQGRSSGQATVNSTDGTVTRAVKRTGNAVKRTGNRVGDVADTAADATRDGAYRAKGAVGNVAEKANRGIQNNLPARNAGPSGTVNVEGSGNLSTGAGVARPPQ
jgi:hypothetical protein